MRRRWADNIIAMKNYSASHDVSFDESNDTPANGLNSDGIDDQDKDDHHYLTVNANVDNLAHGRTSSSLFTPVILCILVTETAERFAYYGFRAVLVLYFLHELNFAETTAIALYGYHSSLCNFTPLFGAYLADTYLGRYCTILIFASVYVLGLAVLAWAAATNGGPTKRLVSFLGLFLVGLGTGGIKPCVSAFGADQISLLAPINGYRDSDDSGFEHLSRKNSDGLDDADVQATANQEASIPETLHVTELKVRTFFNYFYFCINVGAVASIAVVPLLRSRYGFGWAFGLPCLCMLAALAIFVSQRRSYIYQQPMVVSSSNASNGNVTTTVRITLWMLRRNLGSRLWIRRLCPCIEPMRAPVFLSTNDTADPVQLHDTNGDDTYSMERADEASPLQQQMDDAVQLVRILPILAMFPIYWCLYDQQGSVWTLQATRMDLPFGIQAEQLNMVNPVQIMLLIPLFDRIIYPFLEKRSWNISPLRRMSWGMLLTTVAFSISGLVESAIQRHEAGGIPKVNVGWQLPQITILAIGEILLSVTGLEFTYSTAPSRLKAFVAALFLSTSGVGDGLAGVLYSTAFADMNRASVMHVCAALMLGNLAMFVFVAKGYERHERRTEMEMLPLGQGAITSVLA
jgi:proton-dependent oligopeptide transporter, POT family